MDTREFEQDPAEALLYSADFEAECSRNREANTDYTSTTRVRPLRGNGYQYNASTGGRTGTTEPRWPTTLAATVQDGSVTWTCEAISTAGQARTLSSAAWTGDTGITVGSPTTAGTKSTVLISGGTQGQRYFIRCVGTCSDSTTPTIGFYVAIKRPARVVVT